MYKTCIICGKIHDINKVCKRKETKKNTYANKFRYTYSWKLKRESIKQRDKNLCQICLNEKYNTEYQYNYNKLEVHHIVPIEEDFEKRLDSDNLITLCSMHHKMAEEGKIGREELKAIIIKD